MAVPHPLDFWYRWFPFRFARATRHFSLAERGAYKTLIDWIMLNREPIPDNDHEIADILDCPLQDWLAVAHTVRPKFSPSDGYLSHNFAFHEIDAQKAAKAGRSKIASMGGVAKALKNKRNGADSRK